MNICDAIELAEARLYNATHSENAVPGNEKPETLFAFRSDDIGKTVFLSDPYEMGGDLSGRLY